MSIAFSSKPTLLDRIQSHLNMPPLLRAVLAFLFSWRTLFFLLAITNLKNLPFSWHIRLFRGMARHGRLPPSNRKRLLCAAAAIPSSPSDKPKPVHPIFRPLSYHTHAPLLETDYNLHKSNSTYFSDLDLSRGNLMASLIGPALRCNALVPHGIPKGLCYPILGAVHTSFLREIKPYTRYAVRSRVLGWDQKWIVIGSWFVRAATADEIRRDRAGGKHTLRGDPGQEEVVFACVLNKYVIKSGRITVPPELCFAGSGWFPVRPECTAKIRAYNAAKTAGVSVTPSVAQSGTGTPVHGAEKAVDDAANAVQSVALEAGRRLSVSAEKKAKLADEENKSRDGQWPGWTWEEIEAERLRGLEIARHWLAMDGELKTEYDVDMDKGIFALR